MAWLLSASIILENLPFFRPQKERAQVYVEFLGGMNVVSDTAYLPVLSSEGDYMQFELNEIFVP